ncbi:MAG TPA: N-acetyltransferase [Vicinamibacterales bacterium]|nr:N-acetyltransferase [Vicinamibacterales bacterium]
MRSESAALQWIVGILGRLDVPCQAVGGLAARAYGADRPLWDLDLYVPTAQLSNVAREAAPFVVRPPRHHLDDSWDLTFMQLDHAGCRIELGGADGASLRDHRSGTWQGAGIDFARSVPCLILGTTVPTMPVDQLIAYKERLGREVDREDIAGIQAGGRRHVRLEEPGDREAIHQIHLASFPGPDEAHLVDALRAGGHLQVSLVAVAEDRIIGHVAFSPLRVDAASGGVGLAPVAVLPEFRRRGIAAHLMREGLAASARAGAGFVVVLGDPSYYSRFGFEPAARWGLVDEYGGGDAFQALELRPGAMPEGPALVRYAPEFAP